MKTELWCHQIYRVPDDLAKEYYAKIAEAQEWLEQQIVARGVKPESVKRVVRTPPQ